MRTVVALFDQFQDAQQAVHVLHDAGFSQEDINLVARDARGEYATNLNESGLGGSQVTDGAEAGAGIGAVLGGLGGLLLGLGALAIPGVGPVIAAGPIIAALGGAGAGAIAGGIIGALVDLGIPKEHAHIYAEGVRRGGTLVVVRTPDERAEEARNLLNRFNPVDIESRSQNWRQSSWQQFDENGQPLTYDQMEFNRTTSMPVTGSDVDRDFNTGQTADTHREWSASPKQNTQDLGDQGTGSNQDLGQGMNRNRDMNQSSDWNRSDEDLDRPTDRSENPPFATGGMNSDMDMGQNQPWSRSDQELSHDQDASHLRDYSKRDIDPKEDLDQGDYQSRHQNQQDWQNKQGEEDRFSSPASGNMPGSFGTNQNMNAVNQQNIPVTGGMDMDDDEEMIDDDMLGDEFNTGMNDHMSQDVYSSERAHDDLVDIPVTGAGVSGTADVDNIDLFSEADWDRYDAQFNQDYLTRFGQADRPYSYYQPAYRFGYDLGMNPQYTGYDWERMEPIAEQEYRRHGLQAAWDDVKDAVHHAWMSVVGK